jgi:hypothetical protein
MLQTEFEELTGRRVMPAEYLEIEKIYLACPHLNKAEFCKDWMTHKDSQIIADLVPYVLRLEEEIRSLKQSPT